VLVAGHRRINIQSSLCFAKPAV
jgi:hypothetical protein